VCAVPPRIQLLRSLPINGHHPSDNRHLRRSWRALRRGITALGESDCRQNHPMPWFIKRETIRGAPAEVRSQLAAHRAWVMELRARGVRISSGYLVDGEGQPGGGGLLLLEAADHASAKALIQQDPMVSSGCVDWTLHRWVSAVGDLDQA